MKIRDIPLTDLVDINKWQNIQDHFSQVVGVTIRTVNRAGNLITKSSNLSRICEEILTNSPMGVTRCGRCLPPSLDDLSLEEKFECAGNVADNYFVFPNGRVYRCPLCEDFPIHSLCFQDNHIQPTAKLNEMDFFQLDIPEGCVMNRLIQPHNISYDEQGVPEYKIACCLLKEEIRGG